MTKTNMTDTKLYYFPLHNMHSNDTIIHTDIKACNNYVSVEHTGQDADQGDGIMIYPVL